MTLVAFTLSEDSATVVTDSMAYGPQLIDLHFAKKVTALPSLPMVIAAQGLVTIRERWSGVATDCVDILKDMDQADKLAPLILRGAWEDEPRGRRERDDTTIFHVGWSPSRKRFAATAFHSADDFEAIDLTGHALFSSPAAMHDTVVPVSDRDWAVFAEAIYVDSALDNDVGWFKRPLGGDVVATTMTVGADIQQRTVHQYPTQGWRWREMLIGTLAPGGQLGPCVCGSGMPFVMCHLGRQIAGPLFGLTCPCGSTKDFEDCHLVRIDASAEKFWSMAKKDFARTAPALRAAWEACSRREAAEAARRSSVEPVEQPGQVLEPQAGSASR